MRRHLLLDLRSATSLLLLVSTGTFDDIVLRVHPNPLPSSPGDSHH